MQQIYYQISAIVIQYYIFTGLLKIISFKLYFNRKKNKSMYGGIEYLAEFI